MKVFTNSFFWLRICLIWVILIGANEASAQWIDLELSQADPRFEFSGKRYWSKLGGSEEYRFYVKNLTNDTYRLVVRVNLDLACVGSKSFVLGFNRVVYMKGGESFDAFKDDWVHIYNSGADNFKSCRLTDGDTYTLLKGVRYTIEKIENVTQLEAAAADKKKKDDDAKQKIIDDKKKADADAKKKDDDKKKADADAKKKDDDKKRDNGKSASKDGKTEKEDEKTKKDSEESARSAPVDNGPTKEEQEEIARQKAIKDEEDRKKRVQEWRDKKNAETSANEDMATNFLIQAALAYYGLGNLIYSGFEPLGVMEEYTGMASRLRMHLGYEISGTPMYTNSVIEDYNGNSTTFERKTEDHDSYNFNLGAGIEYWPLYHKNFGLGMHAGGSLGHGFTFEDFSLTYQYGLKTHWHPGKLGVVAEYSQGGREIDHSPWIESTESGGGNIAYTYQRIGVGPSIRFDTDWDGKAESRFDLMAIFEVPSFSRPSSFEPAVVNWQNGFRANLSYSNRLDFFLEYFPSYQRDGVKDYGLALSSSSFAGSMFRFGIHRNFDFFGEGGNNSDESKHRLNRNLRNRSILYLLSPGLSWMQNTPGKRFGNYYRFNIMPIAFEQEIDLIPHLALYAGVGINVFEGGELEGYSSSPFGKGSLVNLEYVNVNIPVGLRFKSSLTESHFWWMKVGLGNMLPLYQAVYLDGSSEAAEEDEIMARAKGESLPGYFNSTQISVGADFATGSNIMRCGIEYSVTNQDLLHSLGVGRMQGIRLLIGLTL